MYNNCKNIAQQTIRFLTSVLENINLNINILYSNFQQLYRSISNYGIKPDRSYFYKRRQVIKNNINRQERKRKFYHYNNI